MPLAVPAIAGALTALTLAFALKHTKLPLDHPNQRSLHHRPVPRSGGLAMIPVILITWSVSTSIPWQIWLSCSIIFLLSALDDRIGLPVFARLILHVGAAGFVASAIPGIHEHALIVPIVVVALTWMINVYNFMDGSDGLAGGMAVIGFGTYGLAAWFASDTELAAAAWTVSGAAIGFLLYNFHPARVFLGDAGSIPLGLMAGAMGMLGWSRAIWPLWFPLLVFSPFIIDASITLARRMYRAERIWDAHREHYYQRLVRIGWGHRRTALAEYGLMLGCAALALYGLRTVPAIQKAVIAACVVAYLALALIIDYAWTRHERALK